MKEANCVSKFDLKNKNLSDSEKIRTHNHLITNLTSLPYTYKQLGTPRPGSTGVHKHALHPPKKCLHPQLKKNKKDYFFYKYDKK